MPSPIKSGSTLRHQSYTYGSRILLESQPQSLFEPYMNMVGKDGDMNGLRGNSAPFIYQVAKNQMDNHIVNMGRVGKPVEAPIVGRGGTVLGNAEQVRLFSSRLTAERIRKALKSYTEYDRIDVGLNNSYLDESGLASQLMDWFISFKDQWIIDAMQGTSFRSESSAEHRSTTSLRFDQVDSKPKFGYNELQKVQRVLQEGTGFDFGKNRNVIPAAKMKGKYNCWVMFCDPAVAEVIKTDPTTQSILQSADVRGMDNQLLAPVLGVFNRIVLVEMPRFMGVVSHNNKIAHNAFTGANSTTNSSDKGGISRSDITELNAAGFRQYDGSNYWTGQSDFDSSGELWSRCPVVGMHAIQIGMSMAPSVVTDANNADDFVQATLKMAMFIQKTKWDPEAGGDYKEGSVTATDYACPCVDVRVDG